MGPNATLVSSWGYFKSLHYYWFLLGAFNDLLMHLLSFKIMELEMIYFQAFLLDQDSVEFISHGLNSAMKMES
jgi:hypothetical protein